MDNILQLNDAKEYIQNHIHLGQKAMEDKYAYSAMWMSGPPGIGKSDIFEQVCKENGYGLCVEYMATMLLEQITGLPKIDSYSPFYKWFSEVVNSNKNKNLTEQFGLEPLPKMEVKKELPFTKWSLPELFSFQNLRVIPKNPNKDPMILLLDDAHLCNKTVQGYMFQLLSYRSIHGHILPDNVSIFFAGNRSNDNAGFQQILAPVSNRIFFLDVDNDMDGWIKGYASKNNVRDDIMAFIQYYPQMLNSPALESSAWASPRSWTHASRVMDSWELKNKLNEESMFNILKGHIGTEYALKFIEYKTLLMKWPVEDILLGKYQVDYSSFRTKKIEAYTCITAVSNELLKRFRIKKFKIDKSDQPYLDGFKKLLNEIIKVAKPVVPLGLRILILGESVYGKNILIKKLLVDNPIVDDILTIL